MTFGDTWGTDSGTVAEFVRAAPGSAVVKAGVLLFPLAADGYYDMFGKSIAVGDFQGDAQPRGVAVGSPGRNVFTGGFRTYVGPLFNVGRDFDQETHTRR